jgi:anaerobic ribonucleoside-triphosphate reductase activating protein
MNIANFQFPCFNPYNKPAIEIFVAGCRGNCYKCHNPQLHNFTVGKPFDYGCLGYLKEREDLFEVISFMGGDPLDQNPIELKSVVMLLRNIFKEKEFWLFTRYEINEIPEWCKGVFDYIKTGRYIEELKREGFPASSNQKLLKKGIDY